MAHDALLLELDKRRKVAAAMGGAEKLAKRKQRGQLNAQERLDALVDKDSFIELGLLGSSGVFDEDVDATPRDGKITGFGKVDGRDVGVVVNDFTTKGELGVSSCWTKGFLLPEGLGYTCGSSPVEERAPPAIDGALSFICLDDQRTSISLLILV